MCHTHTPFRCIKRDHAGGGAGEALAPPPPNLFGSLKHYNFFLLLSKPGLSFTKEVH